MVFPADDVVSPSTREPLSTLRRIDWYGQREGAALALDACHIDRAAVPCDQLMHDKEPQAGAVGGGGGVRRAVEALEQVGQRVARDVDP